MLAAAQMLGSSGLTVVVILGGIVAAQMAPRPSLATVPISLAIVATALTTIPASLLMRRVGRRAGFIFGASIGLVGGLVAAEAVIRSDFVMFCAATLLLGSSMAFTQQYRFAAAESAPPERLSQAVSYVLVGSLGAAIVNPQLALAARWLVPGAQYAGSFVAVAPLCWRACTCRHRRCHARRPPTRPRARRSRRHSSRWLYLRVRAPMR
jgi:MFS family permease